MEKVPFFTTHPLGTLCDGDGKNIYSGNFQLGKIYVEFGGMFYGRNNENEEY
jgi:hypothetical protein